MCNAQQKDYYDIYMVIISEFFAASSWTPMMGHAQEPSRIFLLAARGPGYCCCSIFKVFL